MKFAENRTIAVRLTAVAALATLACAPARAETLSGAGTVIDGDSLEVRGKRIRLSGIDAPELQQMCARSGEQWQCGAASAERLRQLVAAGEVSCSGVERDQYLRLLAICTAGGVNLNHAMVAEGWATAFRRYSTEYVDEELTARSARLGLWASEFQPPEDFREATDDGAPKMKTSRAAPSQQTEPRQSGCAIKGNRNRRGEWIYHLPGMPYYEQTVAEEMFCTEAQAAAAGYRRSRAR